MTEERKKRFAFSTPYLPNRVLIVQKAEPETSGEWLAKHFGEANAEFLASEVANRAPKS